MDLSTFTEGLRSYGMPNEIAVWLAYAVAAGKKSPEFAETVGTFGTESLQRAIEAVEKRGRLRN